MIYIIYTLYALAAITIPTLLCPRVAAAAIRAAGAALRPVIAAVHTVITDLRNDAAARRQSYHYYQVIPDLYEHAFHTLYRHYAADGSLLYVGRTNDPGRRMSEHRRDKPWWYNVARTTYKHYDTFAELARAEAWAIATEQPTYNDRQESSWLY